MGKIYLGEIEITNSAELESLSSTTTAHTTNTNLHLSASEKTNLDSLATNITTISGITASTAAINSLSGTVGTMAYEDIDSFSSATEIEDALDKKQDTLFGETETSDKFTYRTTAGWIDIDGTIDVGQGSVKTISGNTVAWNQFIKMPKPNWTCVSGAIIDDTNPEYLRINGGFIYQTSDEPLPIGHKFYSLSIGRKVSGDSNSYAYFVDIAGGSTDLFGSEWTRKTRIGISTSNGQTSSYGLCRIYCVGCVVDVKCLLYIDLTLLGIDSFTTVEQVEQWLDENIGLKDYYPYNEGELIPVKDYKIKSVGFNLWNTDMLVLDNEATITKNSDGSLIIGSQPYQERHNYLNIPFKDKVYHIEFDYVWLSKTDSRAHCDFTVTHNVAYINTFISGDVGTVYHVSLTTYQYEIISMLFGHWAYGGRVKIYNICINLSWSGDRDGEYEPYWSVETPIDVTKLKGKLNGSGSSVTVFPDGLKMGVGMYTETGKTLCDEIIKSGNKTKAIKRMMAIHLGDLSFNYSSSTHTFYCILSSYPIVSSSKYLRCAKYKPIYGDNVDMTISIFGGVGKVLRVCDYNYTDADLVNGKAPWLDGTYVYVDLETPEEYILDDDILPIDYKVDDYGTEELLLGNDTSIVSSSPTMLIKYGINVQDTVKNLPYNYVAVNPQQLTEKEKEQARNNINAASMDVFTAHTANTTVHVNADKYLNAGVYDLRELILKISEEYYNLIGTFTFKSTRLNYGGGYSGFAFGTSFSYNGVNSWRFCGHLFHRTLNYVSFFVEYNTADKSIISIGALTQDLVAI